MATLPWEGTYTHISKSVFKLPKSRKSDKPRLDRSQQLYMYIINTDTIYRKDIEKMSYNNIERALNYFSQRYGVEIIQLDYNTWEVGNRADIKIVDKRKKQ